MTRTLYETIIAARNAGDSWQAISDRLGITTSGARGIYSRSRTPERHQQHVDSHRDYCRRYRLARGQRSRADWLDGKLGEAQRTLALFRSGMSAEAIARKLDVEISTVYKRLRRAAEAS